MPGDTNAQRSDCDTDTDGIQLCPVCDGGATRIRQRCPQCAAQLAKKATGLCGNCHGTTWVSAVCPGCGGAGMFLLSAFDPRDLPLTALTLLKCPTCHAIPKKMAECHRCDKHGYLKVEYEEADDVPGMAPCPVCRIGKPDCGVCIGKGWLPKDMCAILTAQADAYLASLPRDMRLAVDIKGYMAGHLTQAADAYLQQMLTQGVSKAPTRIVGQPLDVALRAHPNGVFSNDPPLHQIRISPGYRTGRWDLYVRHKQATSPHLDLLVQDGTSEEILAFHKRYLEHGARILYYPQSQAGERVA